MSLPVKKKDGTTGWVHQKSAAAAGVKSNVATKKLPHQRFLDVLEDRLLTESVEQTTIRSDRHKLYTDKQRRVGLFAADDKRWVVGDHSPRALGHFRNTEDSYDCISELEGLLFRYVKLRQEQPQFTPLLTKRSPDISRMKRGDIL